jgi:calcineurin-like phosphoesterase family protein
LPLNGHKILIRGNHDRSKTAMLAAGFNEVHDRLEITMDTTLGYHRLYLSHIPVTVAPDERRKLNKYPSELTRPPPAHYDYFLCGHVHELWGRQGNVINVGVDVRDFEPKTLTELLLDDRRLLPPL